MKHRLATLLLTLTAPLGAQNLSGEFSPNPAPLGTPVTFTITDATGMGLNLPSPCTWFEIHQGSQSGPMLVLGIGCPSVIVSVPPGGTQAFPWNQHDQNGQVPAGQYWFRATAWDASFSRQFVDWFCLSIQAPGEPSFTVTTPVLVGRTAPLAIAAPQQPLALYLTALSFSSNNPITVPGLATCLSPPVYTGLANGIGVLDGTGNSSGIALAVPNLPALHNLGLHTQAALLDNGGWLLTNDLSITLR